MFLVEMGMLRFRRKRYSRILSSDAFFFCGTIKSSKARFCVYDVMDYIGA